jgi:hypothetical protein
MTAAEVIQLIETNRVSLALDPDMSIESVERAIVEYKRDPDKPGPAEDRLAWIIELASAVEICTLHVDDRTLQVLRVK